MLPHDDFIEFQVLDKDKINVTAYTRGRISQTPKRVYMPRVGVMYPDSFVDFGSI